DDVGRIVDAERGSGGELLRNAPPSQVLARAHVGGLGARRDANAVVLLHDKARDAAMTELDGGSQAGRAGADDQHIDVHKILRTQYRIQRRRSFSALPPQMRSLSPAERPAMRFTVASG